MSSDLGLISFKDGEPGTLSSALVLQVLKPFIRPVDDELWELEFADGSSGNLSPVVAVRTRGASVSIGRAAAPCSMRSMKSCARRTR